MRCTKCKNEVAMLYQDGLCVTCDTVRDAGKEVDKRQSQPMELHPPPLQQLSAEVPLRGQPTTGLKRRGPGKKPKEAPDKRTIRRLGGEKKPKRKYVRKVVPVAELMPRKSATVSPPVAVDESIVVGLERLLDLIDAQLETWQIRRTVIADYLKDERKCWLL